MFAALRPCGRLAVEFGGSAASRRSGPGWARSWITVDTATPIQASTTRRRRRTPTSSNEAGFTDVNARIVPRPTLLPGRMADWLRTFRQGYLDAAGVPVGEQDALVAETCVVLEPALRDPATGRWYADYVRLRATARRPA